VDMFANMKDVASTKPSQIELADAPARGRGGFVLAAMPGLYIWLVLAAALLAGAYGLRAYGIFRCTASGYGSDGYIGYCNTTSYGDYDHGAFWFGLEPAASVAAASAQVLFVGNSRIEFAFSSQATADWFSSLPASYYLLGFTHFENYTFEAPLLRTLRPKAKVYVINIDSWQDRHAERGREEAVRAEAPLATDPESRLYDLPACLSKWLDYLSVARHRHLACGRGPARPVHERADLL